MNEELTVEEVAPKFRVVQTTNLEAKVVGGKARNTRSFDKADGTKGSVTNWKVKTADGQILDYLAVFDTDADAFEAQIKAGEDINVTRRIKERVTTDDHGNEIAERMATPELSYDSPLGDVDSMFE